MSVPTIYVSVQSQRQTPSMLLCLLPMMDRFYVTLYNDFRILSVVISIRRTAREVATMGTHRSISRLNEQAGGFYKPLGLF
jgi:hypothetical protein